MLMKDLVKKVGLYRATIYSLISCGEFPIRIGERVTGWREAALEAWLARRKRRDPFPNDVDPPRGSQASQPTNDVPLRPEAPHRQT